MEDPDEAQIRKMADTVIDGKDTTDRLVMLDIEHWPTCGMTAVTVRADSVRKLSLAAAWFQNQRPDLLVGFYALPPCRDYWNATSADPAKYQSWQAINDGLAPLVSQINISSPSLYTFYADQTGWVKYARANIAEAQRLSAGKPVYPIVWNQFHDSNVQLKGKYIPADFWKLQLETIREAGAQGIIVWGGWQETWDENAPWWVATHHFIAAQ